MRLEGPQCSIAGSKDQNVCLLVINKTQSIQNFNDLNTLSEWTVQENNEANKILQVFLNKCQRFDCIQYILEQL